MQDLVGTVFGMLYPKKERDSEDLRRLPEAFGKRPQKVTLGRRDKSKSGFSKPEYNLHA
jgi:hypothetical protein